MYRGWSKGNKTVPGKAATTCTEDGVKEIKQYQEKWLQHVQRME